MTETEDRGEEQTPRTTPYRFTQLVATTGRFYGARFPTLFLLFLSLNAVFIALSLALGLLGMPDSISLFAGTVVFISLTVAVSVAFGVTAALLDRYLRDEPATLRDAWADTAPNLRVVVSCGMLAAIFTIIAGQLFPPLVPVFFGPPILIQIAALDRTGSLRETWERSKLLMAGHWSRVIAYLFSLVLVNFILFNLLASAALAATDGMGDTTQVLVFNLALMFVTSITYPFIATAQFVAYADISALDQVPPSADA